MYIYIYIWCGTTLPLPWYCWSSCFTTTQVLIRKMKHPRFSPFTIHGILQMSVWAQIYVSRAFPNGNLILGVDVPFQHRWRNRLIVYIGQILAMVSSYKLCVFLEGGMLISLEIIVLDDLEKVLLGDLSWSLFLNPWLTTLIYTLLIRKRTCQVQPRALHRINEW